MTEILLQQTQKFSFTLRASDSKVAGTQRCFNLNLTLNGRYGRWMDVVFAFCAGWKGAENEVLNRLPPSFKLYNFIKFHTSLLITGL